MNHGSRHTVDPDTAPDATPSADDAPISKTRRKQQMHALQALGERLVKLPAQQLARVPMPEDLAQAVHEARRTKSHEGLRRQMQYIGKLMRSVDASAIEQALAVDEERHQGAVHLMHRAERWRDGLLDGSLSLTDFIDEHPAAPSWGYPRCWPRHGARRLPASRPVSSASSTACCTKPWSKTGSLPQPRRLTTSPPDPGRASAARHRSLAAVLPTCPPPPTVSGQPNNDSSGPHHVHLHPRHRAPEDRSRLDQ